MSINNKINLKSKKIIIPLFVLLVLYLVGHYVYYGSLTRNCIYTERELPVPEQLTKGMIVVAKDAYVAIGQDKLEGYACLQKMGAIDREIIDPDFINKDQGRRDLVDSGLRVEKLKKGTAFRVVGVITYSRHGLTTIDAGIGPYYDLILKDQNDMTYHVSTSFGLADDELFLSFIDPSQPVNNHSVKLLSSASLNENRWALEGEESLTYTGKLTELPISYLESAEPKLKKLADRLEHGEKLTLFIELWLRDDDYKEIKLSDNQERERQIAEIQDNFLKQIPKTIVVKGVEKNAAWPYISMEGNLDLLNYLIDRQLNLKVKSITELIR